MSKTRLFGSIFAAVVLAVFLLACSNPAGPGGNQTQNRQTPPSDTFTPVPPNLITVVEQLEWIRENAEAGGTYVVWARADEIIPAGTDGIIVSNHGHPNITVRIRSDGPTTPPPPRELTLCIDNGPGSMLTVQGGHTLYLQDIILTGAVANNTSLVRVNSGHLRMQNAVIRDNTAVRGGGVSVYNGTFIMNNGVVIHGNTATGSSHNGGGGGVFLNNSTLTMNSGALIHSNQAPNTGFGGGVHARNSSTVNMYGTAKIGGTGSEGNFASWIGGGVAIINDNVNNANTLNMRGGIIQGNLSVYGGGVFIHTYDKMNMYANAAVIGNEATHNGGAGGGVGNWGILYMRGQNARINNNIASAISSSGGGVVVGGNGRLHIYNGEIYNNIASNNNQLQINISGIAEYGQWDTPNPGWNQNGTIGSTSTPIRVAGGNLLP